MSKNLFVLFSLLSGIQSWAQLANDCVDAMVVCGDASISSNATGFGTQELDNTANACVFQEVNSIWLQLNIAESGSLAFVITPDNTNLVVDYDFFVFGPSATCGNFNDPIRCSTTNPIAAGLTDNTTGLRDSENDQNEGPGADGNSFVSSIPVIAGETYYLLVDRPIGNGGFSLVWTGTSEFFEAPMVNEPDDIDLCIADIDTTVDLTPIPNTINNDADVEVTLHTSLADAFDNLNTITNLEEFPILESITTIYTRIQSMNGCFEITEFDINALNFITTNFEFEMCDSDGDNMENFNLTTIFGTIQNSLAEPQDFIISFHRNETDASNNASLLPITNFNTEATTIYARIQSNNDSSCFITVAIILNVIANPLPTTVQLIQCDVDETNSTDGITGLNLEQVFSEIPNASDFDFFYYETELDRTNDNPIANPIGYTNTTAFNQTIFYSVVNTEEGCTYLGELEIQVQPTTVSLNNNSPFFECDENPDDNILESTFNLENIRQTNYNGLEVSFYTSLEDVTLELNPLPENFITQSTTLYVRIENSNQCQSVEEIELVVTANPEFEIPETYRICTDGAPLELTAPLGFDSYTWIRINSNTEQLISSNQDVVISSPGNYRLEIGTQNGNIFCTSNRSFEVLPSNIAIIEAIIIEDFSDNNTVEVNVSGDGDYEYAIDEDNNYQDSNLFENVDPGFTTVFVRDKNGCGVTNQIISVLGYRKFFTPNNDGINDFWQLIGLENDDAQNTSIFIHDRYGKLIAQISPLGNGWDGTYNNRRLPSSDYWFVVNLADNRKFRGHFTLKR